jgi:hypothetical protein
MRSDVGVDAGNVHQRRSNSKLHRFVCLRSAVTFATGTAIEWIDWLPEIFDELSGRELPGFVAGEEEWER